MQVRIRWFAAQSWNDWTNIGAQNAVTPHGYTGHEMLDEVGTVHMNGRVYDQFLGRMLSADPMVYRPLDGQSFNRYSYVNNRPCNTIDLSGFCPNTNGINETVLDAGSAALGAAAAQQAVQNNSTRAGVLAARVGAGVVASLATVEGPVAVGAAGAAAVTTGGGVLLTLVAAGGVYVAAQGVSEVVEDYTGVDYVPDLATLDQTMSAYGAGQAWRDLASTIVKGKPDTELMKAALKATTSAVMAAAEAECNPDKAKPPPPEAPPPNPAPPTTGPGGAGGGIGGGGTNGTSGVWVVGSQTMTVCDNDDPGAPCITP